MFHEFQLALADPTIWTNMFTLDASVSWAEKIVRPILVYAALVVMLRVFGKRELAQLNPFDLVVILSLSNTVQNAIIGPDNSLVGGLVGAVALLAANFAFSRLKYSSKAIEAATEGVPVTLIDHGTVDERRLKSELITKRDLDIVAHQRGFETSDDIERLVLDPNGSFLVDGKNEVKDARFKKDVLKKINEISKQLKELNLALQKN